MEMMVVVVGCVKGGGFRLFFDCDFLWLNQAGQLVK